MKDKLVVVIIFLVFIIIVSLMTRASAQTSREKQIYTEYVGMVNGVSYAKIYKFYPDDITVCYFTDTGRLSVPPSLSCLKK